MGWIALSRRTLGRASVNIAAAIVILAALAHLGTSVIAQAPTPQTVTISGEATLTPGTSVTFRRPSDQATLTVTYGAAPGPVTVAYDRGTLIATVPSLGAFESIEGSGPSATCAHVPNQRNALRCSVEPAVNDARVSLSVLYGDPIYPFPAAPASGLSATPLAAGCTNAVLTFPDGTLVAAVARSTIAPGTPLASRSAVESMWKLDAATQRFLGWSPLPGAPSDFDQVDRLDAIFICMDDTGQLVQPAMS